LKKEKEYLLKLFISSWTKDKSLPVIEMSFSNSYLKQKARRARNTLTGTKFDPYALFELTFLIKFYFIYHILFLVNS
jgi:hypothetical protein